MTNMQVITILACLMVNAVHILASPKGECPATGIVTLPHKKSCDKYYMCMGGRPMLQECADGLLYDHRIQNCNIEREVKCSLDVCPVDHVGIIQMVPHPEDCSRYFACTRGQSFPLKCSDDLLFNQKTGTCDRPEHVTYCGLPTPEPILTHCPDKGVFKKPHGSDCKKYYLCIQGAETVFKCTGDLVFDIKTKKCNHAKISKCAAGSLPQ